MITMQPLYKWDSEESQMIYLILLFIRLKMIPFLQISLPVLFFSISVWVQDLVTVFKEKWSSHVDWRGKGNRVCTGLKSTWIYRTVLRCPWKLNLPWKVLEKHSKALKSPWIWPFTGGFNTVFGDLNQYKIVVPLFGAAYAAPNKGTIILHWFSKTNIFSNRLKNFRSRILTCKSVFFVSFQSLKMVGKSLRSPWKVLEFNKSWMSYWIL